MFNEVIYIAVEGRMVRRSAVGLPVGCLYGSHYGLRRLMAEFGGRVAKGSPFLFSLWISWTQKGADKILHLK